MANHTSHWIRVAASSDVPRGEAKATRLGEGRSIALFNVDGRIYATDNQCPHMGYPLTRGAVRHGILTCDWHGPTCASGRGVNPPPRPHNASHAVRRRWICMSRDQLRPVVARRQLNDLPDDLWTRVSIEFYEDAAAVFKVLVE